MFSFQVLGWPYFSQPNCCHTKVQQATFGGIGLVTETAHVEDDARRAAGFALGVEQQVAKQLEEAKRQAHEEVRRIFLGGGLGGFFHMCQGRSTPFFGGMVIHLLPGNPKKGIRSLCVLIKCVGYSWHTSGGGTSGIFISNSTTR